MVLFFYFETTYSTGIKGGNIKMTKQSNLTMSKVKKQYKQTQQKQNYELKDGLNITFSPIFPHGDVEKLLTYMGSQFKYAEEKGLAISEKLTLDYTLFLCIKYFTHLGKEISDNFEEQIEQMEWLVDTGYFKEICEEVFLQSEIQKVFNKAVEISSKYVFLEKLTTQMHQEVQKLDIKNKDILTELNITQ
jgi:hypothetical protein